MNNSYEWIDRILNILFEAENRYINSEVDRLNQRNCEIKKKQFRGFVHMGDHFVPLSMQRIRVHGDRTLPALDFKLMDEAREFVTRRKKIQNDYGQIKQLLYKLLHPAKSLQEIRDSLPESVVAMMPELAKLNRQQDPTWVIKDDPGALKLYNNVLPKIETYAMTRLLY